MKALPHISIQENQVYFLADQQKAPWCQGEERTGWTLMALLSLSVGPVAVLEDLAHDGAIAYVNAQGEMIECLEKRQESTFNQEDKAYTGYTKDIVAHSNADLMGRKLLAQEGDPDYASVKPVLPPIRHTNVWGDCGEAPHTFIGTRESNDVVPIFYNVRSSIAHIHPNYVTRELEEAVNGHTVMEGLIGGWLPVVIMTYPLADGSYWTMTAYGRTKGQTAAIQPCWFRYMKVEQGRMREVHYYDSYLPYPLKTEPGPEKFYEELLDLKAYWEKELTGGMQLQVSAEKWVSDFCRHCMVNDLITRFGDFPRYGAVIRNYGSAEHDGFQDILTSAVDAYLEWGQTGLAHDLLDNYFTHYVRDNGTLAYRGPEIGQYGRTLAGIAQYVAYTDDAELVRKHETRIRAFENVLLERRNEAKKLPEGDPAYGMLCGHHEADAGFTHPDFLRYDFEVPYFSNSTEAWRGLRDIGRTWQMLGEKTGNTEWIKHGDALEKEAAELHEDILHALAESVLRDRGADFLPAIAGSKEYYYDYPYRSCPEAFDDNRVWCEMMHSGMVPKEYVDMILRDARIHNGMKLGIFGNRDLVVAFICYGEAYGLIQHDMIREMQLFFYAHALHLHTRGTWSAFECVDVDRDAGRCTGYCPPAQMTMPAITKWMLVFENPLSDAVHLCRATPRAWLAEGESISVKDAPTKHGLVSFEIKSLIQDHMVEVQLDIPQRCEEIYLRLRLPQKKHIASVCVDGKPVTMDMLDAETIRVPGTGRMQMTVTLA